MSLARDLADLGSSATKLDAVGSNLIINGGMDVCQRSSSVTGLGASEVYFVQDRYKLGLGAASAGRFTATQETTDVPDGFSRAKKLACTTADTSIAAGEFLGINQHIEANRCVQTHTGTSSAKQITLSFYAKANANATYVVQLLNNKHSGFIHNNRTFDVTTSYQRFSITFQADTTADSKFDGDLTAAGFSLSFILHAGSNFTSATLASDWATGVTNRAAGADSFFSSTSNTFFLTGVQLEVGDTATDFDHRIFGDELLRCQRYYQETSNATNYSMVGDGTCQNSVVSILFDYLCEMRTSPSISALGTNGSSSWYIQSGSTTISTASAAFNGGWAAGTNSQRSWMDWTGISGQTASHTAAVYRNNQSTSNKNGCLAFDAEL